MKQEALTEITATIDRREGRHFTIRFADGQELRVPVHAVSRLAKLGDTIHLNLLTELQAKAEKTELARYLLEEILNGE